MTLLERIRRLERRQGVQDVCVLRVRTEGADDEVPARVTEMVDGRGRIIRVLWPASVTVGRGAGG